MPVLSWMVSAALRGTDQDPLVAASELVSSESNCWISHHVATWSDFQQRPVARLKYGHAFRMQVDSADVQIRRLPDTSSCTEESLERSWSRHVCAAAMGSE